MTKTRNLVFGLAGLSLLLAGACSGQPAAPTGAAGGTGAGQPKVLFTGDSIAADEALALTAAFQAGGTPFESIAEDGGGNVLGPFADKNWEKLPGQIAAAKPAVVVYQITTYDWGSQPEQQAAYDRLLTTATGAGAKLVFVTMPPIRPDDFYQPRMADLGHARAAAQAVAAGSSGRATVLDASAVWGSAYQQTRDGKADRSSDGIHPCPQGAARFTSWLLGELAKVNPGITPPSAESWANTGWAADARFKGC
ncbi:SGNH/GDSL hydrolase family protein [Amycolatopsis sp. NBC_00345]|uniref:SGNH/GDSL hydrolase family protein n=1 Tax=Amycolatopsis sp. NBC_00345 TaxID=2975955 RepID=UPI002E273680